MCCQDQINFSKSCVAEDSSRIFPVITLHRNCFVTFPVAFRGALRLDVRLVSPSFSRSYDSVFSHQWLRWLHVRQVWRGKILQVFLDVTS